MALRQFHHIEDSPGNEDLLWKAFKRGDLTAWEKIFRIYYRDLYGYGLKLSTCEELTRDCIQELFVVLWDRRDHLDEARSVKAYLLASLRRLILKKLRNRREQIYTLDQQPDIAGMQFSAEEIITNDEHRSHQKRALYHILEKLPERQKEVLYLKYFNGMSYDEIEEILSINYQSIRNHMYRAITRLRAALTEEDLPEIIISLMLFVCLGSAV